jgi:hypothetical protein
MMWPFRHKKTRKEPRYTGPPCSYCGSTNTRLKVFSGADQPEYVRVWRGQRVFTYRCLDCGSDFYAEEQQEEIIEGTLSEDRVIDDEETLREAEEKLKKEAEEDNDRRYQ